MEKIITLMFKDDLERARICSALLALIDRDALWTESGPTTAAMELHKKHGGSLSHGESVMLGVAWAMWTGENDWPLAFNEVLYTLDAKALRAVGYLIVALATGHDAIDKWLLDWKV